MVVEVELVDSGGNRYRISGPKATVAAFVARAIRKGATIPQGKSGSVRAKRGREHRLRRDRDARRPPPDIRAVPESDSTDDND